MGLGIFFFFIGLAWIGEAFFSGAETAFTSVNFLKLIHLIEKKNKRAILVHDLLKKPDRLLATTLVGTNLCVVVSSACATAVFAEFIPLYAALAATLVMTPLSFIFAQLLTKTVARYHANRLVLAAAGPVEFFSRVLLPLVAFFSFLASAIARMVSPTGLKKNPFLTKDEVKSLIKDISREGILEPQEKEAIDKIFDMTLTHAADIMVPLKEVVSFDIAEDIASLKKKIRVSSFTRFPVFSGKELKGMVNIFDIFYADFRDWPSLVRPIVRVEQEESLDKVFSRLQPQKENMAAVYKGAELVGILAMEDLMEEITSKLTSAKR
jgi:CBS domain containing-hemolysin-like protein